jgi:hypothetical protein
MMWLMGRWRLLAVIPAFGAVLGWARPSLAGDTICGGEPALATIDGIPAYAMCAAATTSDVWSDNGVDTASTSGGASWTETEPENGYQCTELAARYLYFKWGIDRSWSTGEAKDMCGTALPSSITKTSTGMHGDLLVVVPGCGGADVSTGHVAVVDSVSASSVSVVEQNWTYNSAPVGTGTFDPSCVMCFLHAVANGDSVPDAGVADAAPLGDASDAAATASEAGMAPPAEAGAEASPVEAYDAGSGASSDPDAAPGNTGSAQDSAKTGGGGCALSIPAAGGTGAVWISIGAIVAMGIGRRRARRSRVIHTA